MWTEDGLKYSNSKCDKARWYHIWFNRITIQTVWCAIVPISVFVLFFVEANGEHIKKCKYYHLLTWFVYEFILCLSIFAYVYSWMNIRVGHLSWWLRPAIELDIIEVLELLYFTLIGYSFFSHWMKNTRVHFSLSPCKISAREPYRNQYETRFGPFSSRLQFGIFSPCFAIVSIILSEKYHYPIQHTMDNLLCFYVFVHKLPAPICRIRIIFQPSSEHREI